MMFKMILWGLPWVFRVMPAGAIPAYQRAPGANETYGGPDSQTADGKARPVHRLRRRPGAIGRGPA